ncbi:class I SAM-dependent methyltransferase [Tenacibaculum jejuense]|uniref:Probable phospholipid N-methyltransferase n=1 Tax=Tenacibaculum jejuense TaxID=584609 RepID=A0A238U468_9FLAO|nr:methyltransferase [Tenacibaculum jejuense]SNR13927.1 Probable phospholipid N-methyltransferase [Tenacibaculum jejuense]
MGKKLNFFKEAVLTAKTSGTITPSSRFLAEKMLKGINFNNINLIVELGSGNGVITKHILDKLQPNNHLICFEINEMFYQELLKIEHPQLTVLNTSAEFLIAEIQKQGFKNVDSIISSLPLSIIPKEISQNILNESYKSLNSNGTYVQFQYTLDYYKKLKKLFGKENVRLKFEALNIPPAFIYKCTKK